MESAAEKCFDTEQERQQRLEELIAGYGPQWREEYRPGSFGCHELLDRTAVAARAVEDNLLDHPACIGNPAWYALAEQAVNALNDLYQRIGAEHLNADSKS